MLHRSPLLFVALTLLGLGCSRAPETTKTPGGQKSDNPLEIAVEGFRRASTTAGYRDALNSVGAHTSAEDRARLALPAKTRALLKERFALEDDELKETEAPTFSSVDAYHVEFCYQLRDAKKLLEQTGLTPLAQATRCFDWVVRQVILQERKDDLLPPQAILRLGFGTAAERALLFLAVLHQFQMDGCIIALPGSAQSEPGPLLVGVVLEQNKKSDIHLFDPRLGRALAGPGGQGIATLAQAREQPELLSPLGGPAAAKAELEVFLAPSLQALSPRMKFLEDLLVERDGVHLAHDPEKLLTRIETVAGSKVRVWHGRPPAVTPVRVLRVYLPVGEGGTNKTGRMVAVTSISKATRGRLDTLREFGRMRLFGRGELVPEGRQRLLEIVEELFTKYAEEPRELLLRGQTTQVHQRVDVLVKPLGELDLDAFDEARIVKWRDQVNERYRADPKRAEAVWFEDRFMRGLRGMAQDRNIKVDVGVLDPRSDAGYREVRELTMVVLRAIREPISKEIIHLQARTEHEEAELTQARRQAKGKTGKAAFNVEWDQAAKAWDKYLRAARAPATPQATGLDPLLEPVRTALQRRDEDAWFQFLFAVQHLHKGMTARFLLARAEDGTGNRGAAVKELQTLTEHLAALEKHEVSKLVPDFAARFRGMPLGSLQSDFGEDGGFAWLRRAAELQLREWNKK